MHLVFGGEALGFLGSFGGLHLETTAAKSRRQPLTEDVVVVDEQNRTSLFH